MKYILKLEALALFLLFTAAYFYFFPGKWGIFLSLFFVPDVSFALYLITKKLGAIAYNFFHHQGVIITAMAIGYFCKLEYLTQVALIFLAHSTFDRIFGYGLKYLDNFDRTHLGWIGKSKHLNS